jgi:hypothetical protein
MTSKKIWTSNKIDTLKHSHQFETRGKVRQQKQKQKKLRKEEEEKSM